MFAKLFDSPAYGQVLVTLERDDEGNPSVAFHCEPTGLGVCALRFSFSDDDEGWDRAEKHLADCDLAAAEERAAILFKQAEAAQ